MGVPPVSEDALRIVVTRKCIELDSERRRSIGWVGLSEWTFGEQVAAHAKGRKSWRFKEADREFRSWLVYGMNLGETFALRGCQVLICVVFGMWSVS